METPSSEPMQCDLRETACWPGFLARPRENIKVIPLRKRGKMYTVY